MPIHHPPIKHPVCIVYEAGKQYEWQPRKDVKGPSPDFLNPNIHGCWLLVLNFLPGDYDETINHDEFVRYFSV